MTKPNIYLKALGLSNSEVTVYLAMTSGIRRAADLVKTTKLKRPTVYYALGCLEKRGLISKTGKEGDKKFSLTPLERLVSMAESKVKESEQLKNNIQALIPNLKAQKPAADLRPTVEFFEGVEAVRYAILDMLYCKNGQINSVVPKENFFWQVGEEFVERFVSERAARKIRTQNLWEAPIDEAVIKKYYQGLSQIRILPPVMASRFTSTVFMYDDKVLYVSSLKNSYCVLITSQEHHDTMQAWFDGLWAGSKPH